MSALIEADAYVVAMAVWRATGRPDPTLAREPSLPARNDRPMQADRLTSELQTDRSQSASLQNYDVV